MPDVDLKYRCLPNAGKWPVRIITIGWLCFFAISVQSQCSIVDVTPIPDNDTITLGFNVSGLANANLASPLQGICGIDISFTHDYLGDLTITLISPAGTSVQLVGPPTGGTTSYTQLTTWDVHFVPCGSTANPDAGYSSTWSNDQVWGQFVTYHGSYYPTSGCLEDFNTGSANGQWIIVFEDHSPIEVGSVLNITLLFCDPTGLNCSACIPNGGMLSPVSIDRCEGDHIESSEITIDFGNNTPSSSLYGYQFLLNEGNTILHHGNAFSATLPAGAYSLCGFSYLLADTINVYADLDAGDLDGLEQDILSGLICGDISDLCVPLEIAAPPDTVVMDTNICAGEVFSFGGQNYNSNGTFYQVHDGPGSCDSIFEIHILPRTLSVVIAEPDTLFCNIPMVSLSASATGANGPFNFFWTTSFGNITSSNTLPSITVDQAAPYNVSVTDGICNGVASVTVYADQGFPQIFVDEGIITCNQTSVDLNPIYIPSNGTVLWTGPGGFTSMQADINVTVPGNYELTVTNSQGCATTKQVTIGLDTTTYPINLFESSRNCAANQATLNANTGQPSVQYTWSGPNGFNSNASNPSVTDAGMYIVTITFLNGCQSTASMVFDGDFTIPDITVPANDTLNCSEIITLTVNSTTPGAQFSWVLPNGNGVGQATIQVQQIGVYYGYVSAPNGCSTNLPVEVVQGDDVFPFTVFFDTIDCNNPTAVIGVVSMQADEYDWLNYSGPDSAQSSITVSSPGIYNVLLTDTTSHCNLLASVLVPSSFAAPEFGYLWDTISCLHPFADLSFLPYAGQTYASVYWELPDQSIVAGPVVSSDLPGTYYINAIGSNGCRGVQHFDVPVDTLPPFLLIEADSITCDDTARIETFSVDTITMYNWSGPSIIADSGSSILVTYAGIYTLEAAGLNGCISTFNVLVDSNYTLPVFTIHADSLRCDRPATLSVITNETGLLFNWYDPDGFLIESDSTVDVTLPGIYTVSVQGPNRCFAFDTVELEPVTFPQISISTDTFTCTERFATLDATIDVQPMSIAWLNENQDTISRLDTVTVGDDGPFYLLVTGPNGCLTMDTVSVPYDSAAPHAIVSLIGEIRCQERDVIFDGSASTPASIIFDWSTIGGNILSDPSLAMINAHDSGWYQLIVTTPKNGCRDTAVYHLLPDPDEISQATFDVTRPQCHGQLNGSIALTDLTGGIGPFLYQLNGGPSQVNPVFNSLAAGMYLVTILDSAGCQYDTLVDIPVVPLFSVDAGPDQEIYIGETATLSGSTDLDPNEIQDQSWDSLDIDLCQTCPDFDVSPLETSTYIFEVSSVTGCVLTDEVTVFVLEKGKYFIPNVFSPNGDGINDEVRIYPTPGIRKVLQWIIFDRWGNAVYGKTDFDPNDTSVFWDGRTSTGEFANPAVFPYIFEIQLVNGNIELVHGNITLIR